MNDKFAIPAILSALLGACATPATPTTPTPSVPTAEVEAAAPTSSARFVDADTIRVQGTLPPLPVGLTSFGLASLEGDLYLLGGYHGEPHRYEAAGQSADLYVLRAGAPAWERGPAIDVGLQSVALVRVGDALHRIGGMKVEGGVGGPDGDGTGTLRSVADHARLDPASGRWESLPALPDARSSHDAIAIGDALYVVGGWKIDGAPTDGTYATTMLRFRNGAWESIEAPFQRRALGLAATSRHLVAVGGLAGRAVSQAVDVYDTTTNEWSSGPALPGENTGFGVSVVAVGDAILASGSDGVLHRWRVGEPAWTAIGRFAFPRFFHRLAALPDGTIASVGGIGGMHTNGRTRIVETLRADGSAPAVVSFELPWEGVAKNRQGMFVLGDYLYLFGGNDSLGQHDFAAENFENEGWRVHLPSLSVERRADYPVRRQTMSTLVMGEHVVYSFAGFGHESPSGVVSSAGSDADGAQEEESVAHTHPEIFAYDAENDTWSLRATLPVPRSQLAVAQHEGTVFVMGGLDYDPRRAQDDQFRHLTEILALAPDAAEPRTLTVEMAGGRRAFGHAAHAGHWYVVGGMREEFQLVDGCTQFDFVAGSAGSAADVSAGSAGSAADATEAFAELPCPSAPRLNPQLVNVDGKLVLVGGTTRLSNGELGEDRSIEIFDPTTRAWSRGAAELPFTPKHAQAFAWNGRLLVVSTHDEASVLRLALLDPNAR
jgi:N-acetylneuraminic acid mutarotase